MARLSLGSQHFHAQDKRSSTSPQQAAPTTEPKPASQLNPNAQQPSEQTKLNAQANEYPQPTVCHSRPNIDSYMVQNKLLAMKNSELTQRVADLESQISQLVTENVALQNRGMSQADSNYRMHTTLDIVESVVAEKVSGILQEIERIRAQEELPESNMLTTLLSALSSCRPVTSTPRGDRDFADFDLGQTWGGLPLLTSAEQAALNVSTESKERSVSVASLADLAMIDDLEKSVSPESKGEQQNNVGKLLLPELSTKVSVFADQVPQSTALVPIDEEEEAEGPPTKRTRRGRAKTNVKTEIIKQEPARTTRRRKPLSNVTNKRRTPLRRSKTLLVEPEEVIDNDIFEFVD